MSRKYGKDRSVSIQYAKIPLYYTRIIHPHNKDKELVLMDRIGDNYTAAWRNNDRCSIGIEFLVRATKKGFIYKDKEYGLGNRVL